MSSNQSNAQSRRVKSVARRINYRLFHKKNAVAFGSDLLIWLICLCVFFAASEMAVNNHLPFSDAERNLNWNQPAADRFVTASGTDFTDKIKYGIENLNATNSLMQYTVYSASGVLLLEMPVFLVLTTALAGLIGLYLLQLFWHLLQLGFEYRRIRHILNPFSEIAARADELSKLEFDESKFQLLEEKITSLSTEESLPVTKGDKELEKLETAINNLLLRMRESNMRQARFVNDASHELRTPIAVIEGYSNMLARWGREDEKVLDESITAIQHESSHMKYLVEQLLFLARGDSGKTQLHIEAVNLNELMREIYEESLMIDENHLYRFNCPEETIITDGDPALLKQSVRILVDNAAKYTKERDEIIIGLGRNDEGKPYLQVQDTGIGMAEGDVAHMFERFYRADEARSYKGTGLGLSIAKWIIDKHNGHFEVTSRTELGTRIRIVLGP